MAQQWRHQRFMIDPELRISQVPTAYDPTGRRVNLHVRYHAQRDPEKVFAELSTGLGTTAFNRPDAIRTTRDQPDRPKPPR